MENAKDKEVNISYSLPFQRTLVFQAWTNPEDLKQWFAPKGCSIDYLKLEIYEGGKFHSCIRNPEYGDCWCIGEYLQILPPEKIVYRICNADKQGNLVNPADVGMDPDWPGESLVTITFSESNGITTINLKQTVPEELARKTGAYPSWIQMLDALNNLIEQKQ